MEADYFGRYVASMLDRLGPELAESTYADLVRRQPQSGESPDGPPLAGPIRVYLACADDQARHWISLLLSSSRDIDVVGHAALGPQAIETAAELKPDTILVDIDLPGELGSPASRELARICPYASVIVLTSSVRDELLDLPSPSSYAVRQRHDDLLTAIRTLRAGEITVYPPW